MAAFLTISVPYGLVGIFFKTGISNQTVYDVAKKSLFSLTDWSINCVSSFFKSPIQLPLKLMERLALISVSSNQPSVLDWNSERCLLGCNISILVCLLWVATFECVIRFFSILVPWGMWWQKGIPRVCCWRLYLLIPQICISVLINFSMQNWL